MKPKAVTINPEPSKANSPRIEQARILADLIFKVEMAQNHATTPEDRESLTSAKLRLLSNYSMVRSEEYRERSIRNAQDTLRNISTSNPWATNSTYLDALKKKTPTAE